MAAETRDVVVVGAGHNGLVAGVLLARAGLTVTLVEAASVVGGAARTERPFARAPDLPTSTGAYLLGLMPPELMRLLDLELPLLRRDPHYFLPTTGHRYLLFGSDRRELERQFVEFFSEHDWRAQQRLEAELGALRDDVAPTWFQDPLSIEETAERYVRPALRRTFIELCRGSVGAYLERFGFRSDLVKAMYAVTDGFSGLHGTWDTPGTGMNFLIHNLCRIPGSDGTWMIVQGGMGTVTQALARLFTRAGGQLLLGRAVRELGLAAGGLDGVVLDDGRVIRSRAVIVNADPFRLLSLAERSVWPSDYVQRIDGYRRPGTTLKLNLALDRMPKFRCLPELPQPFGPTIHLLPPEEVVLAELSRAFQATQQGLLPEFPTIEWYVHSTVDPTLTDGQGRLSSAFFVQWVPYQLRDSTWEAEGERYARHLLQIADEFAPGTSALVADMQILHPPRIEQLFGITHGHIHHVDNSFGFADRLPHRTPLAGVYSCSAGTHPAGSVIGCAGYLAARACLRDLGRALPSADLPSS